MYDKTPQASKACGVCSWWGEVLVLGLCVEASLVALAALLIGGSGHQCAPGDVWFGDIVPLLVRNGLERQRSARR